MGKQEEKGEGPTGAELKVGFNYIALQRPGSFPQALPPFQSRGKTGGGER